MSGQQKLSEHQTPTENNSALHAAAGNLAFLLSVIRCGEQLSEDEILNVRTVIERCGKEETQLAEAQAEAYKAYSDSTALLAHAHRERDQAIRERDEARAAVEAAENAINHCPALKEWNPSTLEHHASRVTYLCNLYDGCVHTLGLIVDQRDTLAKVLQALVDKVLEELPEKFAMQVTQNAREALAALDRPAPADGGK